MPEVDIWRRLTGIFCDVFEDDNIIIHANMTAVDIDGWDSLSNIQLILAVESGFGIRLSAAQAAKLNDVGGLVALIGTKLV